MEKQDTKDTACVKPDAVIAKPERFDHDDCWKSLIKRFFWEFLEMALPGLYADADTSREAEFLDKEFSDVLNTGDPEIHQSPHFADYVIKIHMRNGGAEWLILHLEIQGKGGEALYVRMFRYKCLIFAHYKKNPVALAIIIDKRPASEASSYAHSHYGTNTVYEYNNLVLADLDDEYLLSSGNPIALAFYAAKSALRAKEEFQKYNYLYKLAKLLSERGWSMQDKRDLLLFIERLINLKDIVFKKQYLEYRQQLDKEGKIVYEYWLRDIQEEVAREEGMEKGMEKAIKAMAEILLENGISPDIIAQRIAQRIDWPVEKIQAIVN